MSNGEHQGGELYRRWLEELWGGDLEVAGEVLTPDFVGHLPDQDVHGPEGAAEAVRAGRHPGGLQRHGPAADRPGQREARRVLG